MAQRYHQPQAALVGSLDSMQQNKSTSAYTLFGPSQHLDSDAFWHDPSLAPPAVAVSASAYPPKQHTLLLNKKKHKRNRSGCFTCRARRIKCDEGRPVCVRCCNGSRECVYPSRTAPSKGARASGKSRGPSSQSQGTHSSAKYEHKRATPLEPNIDEEPHGARFKSWLSPSSGAGPSRPILGRIQDGQSLQKPSMKHMSDAGAFVVDLSSSSSTEGSPFDSIRIRSLSNGHPTKELLSTPRLPSDLRFYLNFHQEFISHEHFFRISCSDRFINHSIVELALGYEPLLYALVSFSAYHHTLQIPGGRLSAFLKYYNKALFLLRKSLGSGEEHTEATLCTILMLTTFEEYIGDWASLADHHLAAHALIQELLTPESSNLVELHTNIFLWYTGFDVVAGIVAGTEATLSRDWYIAKEHYDEYQVVLYPDDPYKQLVLAASITRGFGLDMTSLYAKLSGGIISMDEFAGQNDKLGQTLESAKLILRQFDDSEYTVRSHPNKRPLTEDDIVDPYKPGALHQGLLWDANYAWIDIISAEMVFKYKSMLTMKDTMKQPLLPELNRLAFDQCRLIEAIDRWPSRGYGHCIGFKNSIGMASMFLPKDQKHNMWSRRKMAMMEQHGYIIAPRFRDALATIWQLPDVHHWWLPNDEGYTEVIREIRAMSEERQNQPRNEQRENMREMKGLF